MAEIIKGVDMNVATDVLYSKPKVTDGRKAIKVYNSKNKTFYLSTPLMLTWGINEYQEKDKEGNVIEGSRKSYDMALQFPNDQYNNPMLTKFLKNMQEFEQKIKTDAITNSKEWLGKSKVSSEVIDALFNPMLKYPKDKETEEADYSRPPTLKVKIPFWEGEFKGFEIYDDKQVLLYPDDDKHPMDLIGKGCHIATILQCGGIYVANGKFGVTWKLFQAVVKPRETLSGKCHIALTDDEKNKLATTIDDDEDDNHKEKKETKTIEEMAKINDTDDEEDNEKQETIENTEDIETKPVDVEDQPKKKKVTKSKKKSDE